MTGRRVLLALGVAATGTGLALAAAPGLARAVPARRRTVLVVGIVALAAAVAVGSRRRRAGFERAEVPDPERLVELPAPGDDVRHTFELASGFRVTGSKEKVRERLVDAAVAVVRRRYDCSEAEAYRLLGTGEWTDDEVAAAFLADERGPPAPRVPSTERLRTSAFAYRVRRTVDAIADLADMEVDR